jgi:hypothetical protein
MRAVAGSQMERPGIAFALTVEVAKGVFARQKTEDYDLMLVAGPGEASGWRARGGRLALRRRRGQAQGGHLWQEKDRPRTR